MRARCGATQGHAALSFFRMREVFITDSPRRIHLGMILQVTSHAGQVLHHLNTQFAEVVGRPDAREHE